MVPQSLVNGSVVNIWYCHQLSRLSYPYQQSLPGFENLSTGDMAQTLNQRHPPFPDSVHSARRCCVEGSHFFVIVWVLGRKKDFDRLL